MVYGVAVIAFFLGAILASFSGVLTERLGTGQSWAKGRSKCNACSTTLRFPDLVPIFSWLTFRGRCRHCTSRITARYAISEVVVGTLFVLGYYMILDTSALIVFYVFVFVLAILVHYDLRHTIVPFKLSLLLIALGALYSFLVTPETVTLSETFITAGIIGIGFFLLHVVSQGRWMGLGDTPVAVALSLLVGTGAFGGLLFSFWIGAVVGIAILVMTPAGRRIGIEVPFVPFLAAGYMLAFFTQWNPLTFLY